MTGAEHDTKEPFDPNKQTKKTYITILFLVLSFHGESRHVGVTSLYKCVTGPLNKFFFKS